MKTLARYIIICLIIASLLLISVLYYASESYGSEIEDSDPFSNILVAEENFKIRESAGGAGPEEPLVSLADPASSASKFQEELTPRLLPPVDSNQPHASDNSADSPELTIESDSNDSVGNSLKVPPAQDSKSEQTGETNLGPDNSLLNGPVYGRAENEWKLVMTAELGLSEAELDNKYSVEKVHNPNLEDTVFLDNYYFYNKQVIEKRISDRMTKINDMCKYNMQQYNKYNKYNMYQFNELGLTWCPVFKSGSTTWRDYFIGRFVSNPPDHLYLDLLKPRQLLSFKVIGQSHGSSRQMFKGEDKKNIRFSLVRHPYSRLVSHVRSSGRDAEMVKQKDLWIKSAMLSRLSPFQSEFKTKTFIKQFDRYINWLEAGKSGRDFKHTPGNLLFEPPRPLLKELVDHIMKMRNAGRDWDGHWMTSMEFCNMCSNKFQYIVKLEEEPLELWYLTETLGLWADRGKFLNHENSSGKKETEMREVWDAIEDLSGDQRRFLEKHFDVDFNMYGYSRSRE